LEVRSQGGGFREEHKNGIAEASGEESDFEAKLNNLRGRSLFINIF
jgi:hypothetical protein